MKPTKITSLFILASIAGAPFAAGSAADGFGTSDGRHFRSPARFNNTKTVTAKEEIEEPVAQEKPAKVTKSSKAYSNDDSLFPPSGKPGECYTRVLVPAPTRETSERVLVKEESVRLVEIPAVLEDAEEKVLVRAASQRQEIVPATFKDVEEQVLVAPAYKKQIPVPAVYETRTERVQVKPERSYWKKGNGPLAKVDNTTGEIMCYVTEPAVYENVTRNVKTADATVREEQVPAVYKTVKRTVVDQPASIKTVEVPAEYTTMKVSRIKSEAKVKRESVPAEYRTITKQVSSGESHMEWRRIICETNVTPALVSDLQTALNAKGFSAGEPTGTLNAQTLKALESYQSANNLPQGGVTIDSLKSLGVKY
jgi:hypothetical protein